MILPAVIRAAIALETKVQKLEAVSGHDIEEILELWTRGCITIHEPPNLTEHAP